MKIVLIGHVCIDHNTSENSSYTGWGSALMYVAHYFQDKLAITPLLIAPYGNDFHKYATGMALLPGSLADRTLVYKNITHNNRRTQQCDHAENAIPVALTDEIKEHITQADIICFAPLLPNFSPDYVSNVIALKKPGSLSVLLPQGYFRAVDSNGAILIREFKEADRIIPLFDMTIFSEDDHPNAVTLGRGWAGKAPGSHIIMTQGPGGASRITSQQTELIETEPVPEDKIVDSVGCGDIFSAATMHNYSQHKDIAMAIKAGNEAARAKLFRVGV